MSLLLKNANFFYFYDRPHSTGLGLGSWNLESKSAVKAIRAQKNSAPWGQNWGKYWGLSNASLKTETYDFCIFAYGLEIELAKK